MLSVKQVYRMGGRRNGAPTIADAMNGVPTARNA